MILEIMVMGSQWKVFMKEQAHAAAPSFWLLTDVRRNQNTACIRYCRADGWGRGKNAITVAIITQISLPLYLSPLFNTGINHHHIHYAASYHTQGRTKRTNIILSGRETTLSIEQGQQSLSLINNGSYYDHK